MQTIIERAEDHFNQMEPEMVIDFIKKNYPEIGEEAYNSTPLKRKFAIYMVTEGYTNYFDQILEAQDSTLHLIRNTPDILPHISTPGNVSIAYQFYRNLKFSKTNEVIIFFTERGIRDMYLGHFVDINQLEEVMLNIIKAGIAIDFRVTLLLVDMAYDFRISKELSENFIDFEIRETYDGRKNVKEIDIEILRILEKRKNPSKSPRQKSEFDLKMNELLDHWKENPPGGEFIKKTPADAILDSVRDRNCQLFKIFLTKFLRQYTPLYKRSVVINIFKPLFHIIFEDTSGGLLTEETFQEKYVDLNPKLNRKANPKPNKYPKGYKKYYGATIRTLTGI